MTHQDDILEFDPSGYSDEVLSRLGSDIKVMHLAQILAS